MLKTRKHLRNQDLRSTNAWSYCFLACIFHHISLILGQLSSSSCFPHRSSYQKWLYWLQWSPTLKLSSIRWYSSLLNRCPLASSNYSPLAALKWYIRSHYHWYSLVLWIILADSVDFQNDQPAQRIHLCKTRDLWKVSQINLEQYPH